MSDPSASEPAGTVPSGASEPPASAGSAGSAGGQGKVMWIASWVLPLVGMAIAYTVLAWSSETDAAGKAWMALGFGFVVVLWIVFRVLVERTALPRAVAGGDTPSILAITDKQLARRKSEASRAPFLVYRAYALEWSGQHPAALAALAEARSPAEPGLAALAGAIRVLALVETGEVVTARRVLDDDLEPRIARLDPRLHAPPHLHARLARGRLLLAEGKSADARDQLQRVVDDIRAGNVLRDRARTLSKLTG